MRIDSVNKHIQAWLINELATMIEFNQFISNPGFQFLAEYIFSNIDFKGLAKCRQVSKLWKEYIDSSKALLYLQIEDTRVAKFNFWMNARHEWYKGCTRRTINHLHEEETICHTQWEFAFNYIMHVNFAPYNLYVILEFLKRYLIELKRKPLKVFKMNLMQFMCKYNEHKMLKLLLQISSQIEVDGVQLLSMHTHGKWDRTPLHNACKKGNYLIVLLLEKSGLADFNSEDNDGNTPLHLACEKGQNEIVKLILHLSKDTDTNINARNINGKTPFHVAVFFERVEVIKTFLNCKSPDIDFFTVDNRESTPLLDSVLDDNVEILQLSLNHPKIKDYIVLDVQNNLLGILISKAVDMNEIRHDDTSYMGTLECLLDFALKNNKKIDLNIADNYGMTPIHHVCKNNRLDQMQVLLEYAELNGTRIDCKTPDKHGMSPLSYACMKGNLEMVKPVLDLLLKCNETINVNVPYKNKEPLFHRLLSQQMYSVLEMILKYAVKQEQVLEIDKIYKSGKNILHFACKYGNKHGVEPFLEYASQKNIEHVVIYSLTMKDSLGKTPLHYAFEKSKTFEVIDIFIQFASHLPLGIDFDIADRNGKTVLQYACLHGNFTLISTYLNHTQKSLQYKLLPTEDELYKMFMHQNWDSMLTLFGNKLITTCTMSFFSVCVSKDYEAMELMLLHNLIWNRIDFTFQNQNNNGYTALHYAVAMDSPEIVTKLCKIAQNKGQNIGWNVKDNNGMTPLHLACAKGRNEIVMILSSFNTKDNYGKTFLNPVFNTLKPSDFEFMVDFMIREVIAGNDDKEVIGEIDEKVKYICSFACESGNHQIVSKLLKMAKKNGIEIFDTKETFVRKLCKDCKNDKNVIACLMFAPINQLYFNLMLSQNDDERPFHFEDTEISETNSRRVYRNWGHPGPRRRMRRIRFIEKIASGEIGPPYDETYHLGWP